MMKPAVKTEEKKSVSKAEPAAPLKVKTPEKKVESPKASAEVKTDKKSPDDSKAAAKVTANKKGFKNQPVLKGKGTINSFFNSKPSTSKEVGEKPMAHENISKESKVVDKKVEKPKAVEKPKVVEKPKAIEKETPIEIDSDDDEPVAKSRKRSLTPEKPKKQEKKKPAAKKIKLKEQRGKRSRIRVMQDSSEEEAEKSDTEEPDSKFIKFDREFTPEPVGTPSPVKDSPAKKTSSEVINKRKAKRWVTKRSMNDEGFMVTERVQEEYSASEGENDENKKKNSPPKEKATAEKKSSVKREKSSEQKEPPSKFKPAAKGKQGNITSFFTRK